MAAYEVGVCRQHSVTIAVPVFTLHRLQTSVRTHTHTHTHLLANTD